VLVLGLDPGSHHTGYGLVERRGSGLRAVAQGRISCPRQLPLAPRLARLAEELAALIDGWRPDAAALEAPFHGVNTRSLIVLAEARGVLLGVLGARGIATREYSPAEVKTAVTGSGRAEKRQVARMVCLLLGLQLGVPTVDATDALAVAICCAQRARAERLAEQALARK
jgi:crossover junction endodeoxyribonuclease RuvC